jgi:hypothetical protein
MIVIKIQNNVILYLFKYSIKFKNIKSLNFNFIFFGNNLMDTF